MESQILQVSEAVQTLKSTQAKIWQHLNKKRNNDVISNHIKELNDKVIPVELRHAANSSILNNVSQIFETLLEKADRLSNKIESLYGSKNSVHDPLFSKTEDQVTKSILKSEISVTKNQGPLINILSESNILIGKEHVCGTSSAESNESKSNKETHDQKYDTVNMKRRYASNILKSKMITNTDIDVHTATPFSNKHQDVNCYFLSVDNIDQKLSESNNGELSGGNDIIDEPRNAVSVNEQPKLEIKQTTNVSDVTSQTEHLTTKSKPIKVNGEVEDIKYPDKSFMDINKSDSQNKSTKHIKERKKNEFGYKGNITQVTFDNRACFHNGKNCSGSKSCVQNVEMSTENGSLSNVNPRPNLFTDNQHKSTKRSIRNYIIESSVNNTDNTSSIDITHPKSISEWLSYSQQITAEVAYIRRSGKVQTGKAREVYLVLDTSERMKGSKFESMISAAVHYIEGIRQVASVLEGHDDSIGLATFGGQNTIVQIATSNYDLVLNQIVKLQPKGDAPVIGGIVIGMAGVLAGPNATIGGHFLQGHMIIFTDGTSEDAHMTTKIPGAETLWVMGDFYGRGDMNTLMKLVARMTKIYYVPIGDNQKNPTLERAVSETRGKVIQTNELYRLIKLTQVIRIAANMAPQLKYLDNPSRDTVRTLLAEASSSKNGDDDCVDWVMEFLLNPLSMENREGLFVELNCSTLQLGDRVRRGPDWSFGNQDAHLPGTVIGQRDNELVRVEWDNGHQNVYMYDEDMHEYNIIKVNDRRILVDEMIAVGCRVTRGHDWKYGNTDGGPGSLGTVLSVREDGRVVVRWDCRKTDLYKMGYKGKFEISVCSDLSGDAGETTCNESNHVNRHIRQRRSERESSKYQSDTRNTAEIDHKNDYDYVIPIYSEDRVSAVWEYNESEKTWRKYSPDINTKIEKAYQENKTGKTFIEIDRSQFLIDFTTMVQENPRNHLKISIRRLD